MVHLRHLQNFVVVAEELHFGRAASRIEMSQPALSQAIRKLESEVGVELFERSSRSVELTDAGQVFLDEARIALAQVEHMMAAARATAKGERGPLHFGYAPSVPQTTRGLLADFARAHDDVSIDHRLLYTTDLVDVVESGELDAACIVGHDPGPPVGRMPLRDVELVGWIDPKHPLAREESVAFAALEAYPFALVDIPGSRAWMGILRDLCARHRISPRLVPAGDPLLGAARDVLRDRETVWVSPLEYVCEAAVPLRIDPPVTMPVDLIWLRDHVRPVAAEFIRHAQAFRDASGWLTERPAEVPRALGNAA